MQKYFHDVRKFVETNYPELKGSIIGDVYPPPWYALWISSICGWIWLGGIILIFAGSNLCQSFGIREPQLLTWINNNKIQTFMVLFMMNNVASSMLSTGAFEVYLDGNLVFSKLEMKRFPQPQDIIAAFEQYGIFQS
jgi:selT/selW/selH-like putative selenoprotein